MSHFNNIAPRKLLRLPGYNYHLSGYYYVTLCIQNRQCLFGEIKNSKMILNKAGQMIHNAWTNLANKYSGVENDVFIVMPNHLHGILLLNTNEPGPARGPAPTLSLPELMRNFKSFTTTSYMRGVLENNFVVFEKKLWQRNYYEHIIRTTESLEKIRQYIVDNPEKWDEDRENPYL